MNADCAIPETADAVRLFLFTVLPSVFPFCVISEWLVRTEAFARPGKKLSFLMRPLFGVSGKGILALLTGLIGSYPTGARTVASLYQNKQISREDAVALSAFTNNAGPLFIIGFVGAGLLGSAYCGILLWLCHVAAALLTGMLLKPRHFTASAIPVFSAEKQDDPAPAVRIPPFQTLSLCIAESARTMVPVAGSVIFFAAVSASFSQVTGSVATIGLGLLRLLLEMTSGCRAAAVFSVSPLIRVCLLSAAVSWGGLSVHTQVLYILNQNGLSGGKYLLGKAVHTLLSVLITALVFFFTVYR